MLLHIHSLSYVTILTSTNSIITRMVAIPTENGRAFKNRYSSMRPGRKRPSSDEGTGAELIHNEYSFVLLATQEEA